MIERHRREWWRRRRRGGSAVGATIEAPNAPRVVGCREGVSPSPLGEGFGKGAMPRPQKIFPFLVSK